MKSIISIICLFLYLSSNCQDFTPYVPVKNVNITSGKYNTSVERIQSAIDTITLLQSSADNYSYRVGEAWFTLLLNYEILKEGVDTLYHCAENFYNTSPKRFCGYWDFYLRQLLVEELKTKIAVKEERPELWDDYCEKCRLYKIAREVNKKKESIKMNSYAKALMDVEFNDQLYRKNKTIDWSRQDGLDSLNRIALDSLFEVHGFPTTAALDGQKSSVAWLVLQHSNDCVWIKKWIERFLDAQLKGGEISGHLLATFDRFFESSGNAYCSDSDMFIRHLISKYPISYARQYKYDNYFK